MFWWHVCPGLAEDALPANKLADPPQLSQTTPTNAAAAETSLTSTNSEGKGALRLNSMDLLDEKYKLGIGDRMSFRVIEDQDEPKLLVVNDAGNVEVPYIGLFKAQDKTCKQLAEEIKVPLEKEYYYRATVIIALEQINKTVNRGKIYLVGFVRTPGAQDIPAEESFTVSKAILRAGGFTDFADKRKVRLVRKTGANESDKKTMIINVADIWEKGKSTSDVVVEPEDLIYVPARLVNF